MVLSVESYRVGAGPENRVSRQDDFLSARPIEPQCDPSFRPDSRTIDSG
jgi:hypothetical protein